MLSTEPEAIELFLSEKEKLGNLLPPFIEAIKKNNFFDDDLFTWTFDRRPGTGWDEGC